MRVDYTGYSNACKNGHSLKNTSFYKRMVEYYKLTCGNAIHPFRR